MSNKAEDLEKALVILIESLPADICIPAAVSSTLIKWSIPVKGVCNGRGHHRSSDRSRNRSAVSISGNSARVTE